MPNLLINVKIVNPIIKDSIIILDNVRAVIDLAPYMKTKEFYEILDQYLSELLVKMNLSRFMVGADTLLVDVRSLDVEHKLLVVSHYKYKTPTEIIKVYS